MNKIETTSPVKINKRKLVGMNLYDNIKQKWKRKTLKNTISLSYGHLSPNQEIQRKHLYLCSLKETESSESTAYKLLHIQSRQISADVDFLLECSSSVVNRGSAQQRNWRWIFSSPWLWARIPSIESPMEMFPQLYMIILMTLACLLLSSPAPHSPCAFILLSLPLFILYFSLSPASLSTLFHHLRGMETPCSSVWAKAGFA